MFMAPFFMALAMLFSTEASAFPVVYPPAPMPAFVPGPLYGFAVQPAIQITPYQVTAGVQNLFGLPIQCQGRLIGMTSRLGPVWFDFVTVVIPPGLWEYAYINPPPGDFFVNGSASVFCRYL